MNVVRRRSQTLANFLRVEVLRVVHEVDEVVAPDAADAGSGAGRSPPVVSSGAGSGRGGLLRDSGDGGIWTLKVSGFHGGGSAPSGVGVGGAADEADAGAGGADAGGLGAVVGGAVVEHAVGAAPLAWGFVLQIRQQLELKKQD